MAEAGATYKAFNDLFGSPTMWDDLILASLDNTAPVSDYGGVPRSEAVHSPKLDVGCSMLSAQSCECHQVAVMNPLWTIRRNVAAFEAHDP